MNKVNSKDNNTKSFKEVDTNWINDLYNNYVNSFVDQLTNAMTGNTTIQKYFKRDDTVNGIPHPEHIMYKLIVNPTHSNNLIDSQKAYQLKPYDKPDTEISTDPHRRYEFVIEFDKGTPDYGIYYGCRGLIRDAKNKEDSIEQAKRMYEEWASIEDTVTTVLNNTFPKKDFTKSYRRTNNDNNYTFWPFWIALGDNEDICDIAARATAIICKCYQALLLRIKNPTEFLIEIVDNEKKRDKKTCFTQDSYIGVLNTIQNKLYDFHNNQHTTQEDAESWAENGRKAFEEFLLRLVNQEEEYVSRSPLYEKAWIVNNDKLPNHTFYMLIVLEWQWIKLYRDSEVQKNIDNAKTIIRDAETIMDFMSKREYQSNDKYKIDTPPELFDIFLTKSNNKYKPSTLKNDINTQNNKSQSQDGGNVFSLDATITIFKQIHDIE